MKKICLILAISLTTLSTVSAQNSDGFFEANKAFTGAKASKKKYHAIYQLDNADAKIIEKAFRNINNALKDPRLEGKIEIELISFGGGTELVMKGSKYEEDLKALVEKGVIVAQCNNSLKERKLTREQLYDFIAVVPSGNGELIIRQAEGWSVIKP
jgi:uncharacterized protein